MHGFESSSRVTGRRAGIIIGIATALSLAAPHPRSVFAHPVGVLSVFPKQVSAGDTIVVRGAKLGPNSSFRVELRGTLSTFSFGRIRADSTGAFQMRVPVPLTAGAGSYTVVAVAADGDVSAQADLAVSAAGRSIVGGAASTAAASEKAHMPGMPGMSGMHMEATAEKMQILRTTTPLEWGAIAAVILIAASAGLLLLRSYSTSA